MTENIETISPSVSLRNLALGYGQTCVLCRVSANFDQGSLTALVGQNGTGKSTLLKAIAGLLRPQAGMCRVQTGHRVAYLAQRTELDWTFPARVNDIVRLGLWPKRGLLGRYRREDAAAVADALRRVGLDGFGSRPIDRLSGGQLQRALFARVIVQDARLLLLDEPFVAVDEESVVILCNQILRWTVEGRTVIVAVHDRELVQRIFPNVLLLKPEGAVHGATRVVMARAA